MCLETTKQGYVILAAFNQAGAAGLTWSDLIDKMKKISERVFDEDCYVNGPWPLMTSLDNVLDSGEVSENDAGLWTITDRGIHNYNVVRDNYVKPEFPLA